MKGGAMTCSYCRSKIVALTPTCPQCGGPLHPSSHDLDDILYENAKSHLAGRNPYYQRAILDTAAGAVNEFPFDLERIKRVYKASRNPPMRWMPR
jgi:hypothetical protein